jgi:hypothetical protein
MGASASALERARARIEAQRPPPLRIWRQHWHAWQVFVGMDTQWRTRTGAAGTVYDGLDYAALDPVLQEHRRALPRRLRQPMHRLMPQLRVLEHAALRALNG